MDAKRRFFQTMYASGFRGFEDTLLELHDVNFLVGENSTGKTSMMSLIALMSEFQFWLSPEFNTESVSLGTFEDIASAQGGENPFWVGIFDTVKDEDGSPRFKARLMTFTERQGLPVLKDYVAGSDQQLFLARPEPGRIRYKFRSVTGEIDSSEPTMDNARRIIHLVRDKSFKSMNFKSISAKATHGYPMFLLPDVISRYNEDLRQRFQSLIDIPARDSFSWMAPIRAKPKQVYPGTRSRYSPEGEHSPYVLKSLLLNPDESDESRNFVEVIERFGQESGLFDTLRVRPLGRRPAAPFELEIIKDDLEFRIASVGYGVSQIVPILAEILSGAPENQYAIQQPEVHLHPRAQAAFGELIHEIAVRDRKRFIIETHSDYMIDRFRYARHMAPDELSSKVVYFERQNKKNTLSDVAIQQDGRYPDEQPDNFRAFFLNESLKLMEV